MEIKTLEKKQDKVTFLIKGIDHAVANTLRRLMSSEVPVLAIDEVDFHKNSSALYDEMVAHRLGLVPIETDLKSYNEKSKCKCKGVGCPKCQLSITLSKKGPCTVYSGDLEISDPKLKPVFDKIPITKLLEGQELEFEATAVLGCGKEHAKFSPALVFFRNYPKVSVKEDCEKAVQVCPRNVFEYKNKKLSVKNLINCDLCNACVEACGEEKISVSPVEDEFIFTVESWGQLNPKEIFETALDIFDEKLDEFNKLVKAI
ncbi:MAG: DNA-directed RNA polymerase subunit D [Candidatus Nanoarchaeia archaeon]|nr:DNA-directed RNA polymerase subunit D [Candidatus Nanoarchaeia archaeon]MDD5588181.1 DNA-directed RNA polymerase subunit D [Candidatus Nanoarchaeia archaeon]